MMNYTEELQISGKMCHTKQDPIFHSNICTYNILLCYFGRAKIGPMPIKIHQMYLQGTNLNKIHILLFKRIRYLGMGIQFSGTLIYNNNIAV